MAEPQDMLNGAQLQALQRQYQEAIAKVFNEVKMREMALEHATKILSAHAPSIPPTNNQALELIRSIHTFLTEHITTEPPASL